MGVNQLSETPASLRMHIAVFGRTNSGKSSIINAATGQQVSLVSEVSGTTTDPVSKARDCLLYTSITGKCVGGDCFRKRNVAFRKRNEHKICRIQFLGGCRERTGYLL